MYTTRTTLLQKISSGDEIGWEEFFRTYRPLIHALTFRRGIPETDADDIAQQTMLAVFRNGIFAYDREKHGKFRTYLGGIIRHKIFDYFRDRQAAAEAPPEDVPEPAEEEFDALFLEEYRKYLLDQAIAEMRVSVPPEAYEAFQLCVLRGCKDKEAAALLGSRPNTVTVRKQRCLRRLRQIIARLNADDNDLRLHPPC